MPGPAVPGLPRRSPNDPAPFRGTRQTTYAMTNMAIIAAAMAIFASVP